MNRHDITLATIRRAWTPTMRALGFVRDGAAFTKRKNPIQHRMHIRALRNRSTPSIVIDLLILVENPFETDHRQLSVFTQGYLNPRGEPHAIRGYWEPAAALVAHERFEEFALPFFDRFSTIDALLTTLTAASARGVVPQSALLGHSSPDENASPPPANYEMESLLYWHKRDVRRAIQALENCLDQAKGTDLYSKELRGRLEPRLVILKSKL
jgi:hypothetical protein